MPLIHACVTDPRHGTRDAIVRELAPREVRFVDEEELRRELPEIEMLVHGVAVPNMDWSRATRLRLIHFLGAGVDGFFPARGLPPNVVVANARGIHGNEMRDHALA